MPLTIPSRTPWEDRFRTPTAAELRGAIVPQFLPPFDHARAKFAHISGVIEAIRWHGVWKWTFEYTCAGATHAEPFAFLVPDPAKPRLCVSIPDSVTTTVDVRKLPKLVRETLGNAPSVDGIRWATWDVATKSGMDEVVAFIAAYRTATAVCADAVALDAAPMVVQSAGSPQAPGSGSGTGRASAASKPRTKGNAPASTAKTNPPKAAALKAGAPKASAPKASAPKASTPKSSTAKANAAKANGTASSSTSHKSGSNGTRRARGD